jgi:aspartate aminotransferase-like enzyme
MAGLAKAEKLYALRDVKAGVDAGWKLGQGSMEGNTFRVNHMGYTDLFDVLAVVSAIELVLTQLGHKFEHGAGVMGGG